VPTRCPFDKTGRSRGRAKVASAHHFPVHGQGGRHRCRRRGLARWCALRASNQFCASDPVIATVGTRLVQRTGVPTAGRQRSWRRNRGDQLALPRVLLFGKVIVETGH